MCDYSLHNVKSRPGKVGDKADHARLWDEYTVDSRQRRMLPGSGLHSTGTELSVCRSGYALQERVLASGKHRQLGHQDRDLSADQQRTSKGRITMRSNFRTARSCF